MEKDERCTFGSAASLDFVLRLVCNLVTVSAVTTFCVFSEEWIITFWKMSPAVTAKSRSVMSQCFMTRVGCACFVVYHWRNREGRDAQEANPDSLDVAVHLALCEEDFHHFSVTEVRHFWHVLCPPLSTPVVHDSARESDGKPFPQICESYALMM